MRFIYFLLFLCLTSWAGAQIEISKETVKKQKQAKPRFELSDSAYTEVMIGVNYSLTDRLLIENQGLFAEPLGERENEFGLNKWSFSLSMRNRFHPNFAWSGGIRYLQLGEGYEFEEFDSTYAYQTTYRYISMPLRLEFLYGKRFGVEAGVGIEPQMLASYLKLITYKDTADQEVEERLTAKNELSSFVLSVHASVGVYYRVSDQFTIHLVPEFRRQITSSFFENAAYKHFGYAWGANVMIGFRL